MPDESPTADIPQQPPKRPWRRLHFSSWCIALLTLAVLLVLNIPGSFGRTMPGWERTQIQHGWPLTMLERRLESTLGSERFALWTWSIPPVPDELTPGVPYCFVPPPHSIGRTFYPAAMVGNVAVAVVLLAVVALLAEWRRRRRNHFWQVTLAEGLTACSILAVLSAWVGWHVNDTQRQRAAVDTISLHGDGTINAYWESRLPDWWEALGDEVYPTEPLLGQVVRIASRDMPGDHVLQELRHLPAIRELFLGGTPLSDPALLAELKHLPNLQLLDLSRTGISDQDLKPIAACETLVDLDLSHNPISDEGLEHLHRLRHLRFLNLTNVDVSVEGVDALQAALPDVVITDD